MRPNDADPALFAAWEGALAFRLFSERQEPTLTVPEQIAAQLGERILAGHMAPGSRIGEQELADEFKVSRGPVREAIRMLEREGLATVLARRGAIVTELSAAELRELFEIRAGLFDIIARRLAEQRDPAFLALMRSGLKRLEELAEQPDAGDAYAETTYRLLMIAARFCGNRRLQQMMNALSLQTLRYSKLGLAAVERRRRSVRLWRQALVALEKGDAERAMVLTRQRIQESGEEAARQLEGRSPAP